MAWTVSGNIKGPKGDTGDAGTNSWAGIPDKPTTFAPSAHSHSDADISNASTVGKAVLEAADAGAARTAIGAGTSSLSIGTAGGTACAGNDSRLPAGADIVDADISASAAIALSKLATGRVAGSNNGSAANLTMWIGTATQYAAIGSKDAATVYFVTP